MRSSQRRRLISRLVKPISIMYPQHVDERWGHLDEGSEGFIEVVRQTLTIRRDPEARPSVWVNISLALLAETLITNLFIISQIKMYQIF